MFAPYVAVEALARCTGQRVDQVGSGRQRTDQARRDDDDQFFLVLGVVERFKERADDGQVAEQRHLVDVGGRCAADQPTDHKALAIAQLDRGICTPGDQRGHRDAIERDGVGIVQIAGFGGDLERCLLYTSPSPRDS